MGLLSSIGHSISHGWHKLKDTVTSSFKEIMKGHFGKAFEQLGQLQVDIMTGGDTVEKIANAIGFKDQEITQGDFSFNFFNDDRKIDRINRDTGLKTGTTNLVTGYQHTQDLILRSSIQDTFFLDGYLDLYSTGFRVNFADLKAYAKRYYKHGLPDFVFEERQAGYTVASMLPKLIAAYKSQFGFTGTVTASNVRVIESTFYSTIPPRTYVAKKLSKTYPFSIEENLLDYSGDEAYIDFTSVTAHSDGSAEITVDIKKNSDNSVLKHITEHYTPQHDLVAAVIEVTNPTERKHSLITNYLVTIPTTGLVKETKNTGYEIAPIVVIRENKNWIAKNIKVEDYRKYVAANTHKTERELFQTYRTVTKLGLDIDPLKKEFDKGDVTNLQTVGLTSMASLESTAYSVKYYIYEFFNWLINKISYDSSKYAYFGYGDPIKVSAVFTSWRAYTTTTGRFHNKVTHHHPAGHKWEFKFQGVESTLIIQDGTNFDLFADLKGTLALSFFEDSRHTHPSKSLSSSSDSVIEFIHTRPLDIDEGEFLQLIAEINERRKKNTYNPYAGVPPHNRPRGWFGSTHTALVHPLITEGNPVSKNMNIFMVKEGPVRFVYTMQYIVNASVTGSKKALKTDVVVADQTKDGDALNVVIKKYKKNSYTYRHMTIKLFSLSSYVFIAGTNKVHMAIASRDHKNIAFPIVTEVLHKLPFPFQEEVISRSVCTIAYSGAFTQLKYYQTRQFGMFVQFVMIFIAIISMNPAAMAKEGLMALVYKAVTIKIIDIVFDKLIEEVGSDDLKLALSIIKGALMVTAGAATFGSNAALNAPSVLDAITAVEKSVLDFKKGQLDELGQEAMRLHKDYMSEVEKAQKAQDEVDAVGANLAKAGKFAEWMVEYQEYMDVDSFYARWYMDSTSVSTDISGLTEIG